MADEDITEATSLMSSIPKPRYAFESSITRKRKRRVRQFQCCVCSIFLGLIIVVMVISVGYNMNGVPNEHNITDVNINETLLELFEIIPLESVQFIQINDSRGYYDDALDAGNRALKEREDIEETTPELDKTSPSYKHQKVVATSEKGRQLSRLGYAEGFATKHLAEKRKNITGLCFKGTSNELFSGICNEAKPTCNFFQKFRSYNGSCNNLHFYHGVAYSPFRRILPPDYSDGISSPRVSKSGDPLPSARTISNVVHRPIYRDDPKFTVMLAVFGQFLDHDITATALNQGRNGNSISCCSEDIIKVHPECFPVQLDEFDGYYNITCMEFVRSAAAPTCCFGPRQQLNQASAYIDGSVIYGSDEAVVTKLREFRNGELKMLVFNNMNLLPVSEDKDDGCNREEEAERGRYCFMTGDARANENLHLTSMHLIWARQHNLIARELLKLNPGWDDERVFQETRRLLIGQMQHVTYNEFLPIVLGEFSERFDLKPLKEGYFRGYNASLDASIANGFAASAFRFAHTLIPSLVKMMGKDNSSPEFIELHKMLFDPFQLYKKGVMDRAIRGAMHTRIQASDAFFTPELKEHMFQRPVAVDSINSTKLCGLDLVSLNIQRGRDHGLAGYASWREHCGLPRPRTFDQLTGDIDDDSLNYIRSIYRDVDDIDFYTGAVSEKPLKGGFLGPTFTCILLDQFIRLKRGDRFYYENHHHPQAFTLDQLKEIRQTSLARIICDNSDDLDIVQPFIMKRADAQNTPTSCTLIPKLNFKPWKENLSSVSIANEGISSRRN